jgi:hypothetical protein
VATPTAPVDLAAARAVVSATVKPRTIPWAGAVAALMAAVVACRSGGPRVVSAPGGGPAPDFVRAYVGQRLILRRHGAVQRLDLERASLDRKAGDCDVAVEVTQSGFENGTLRLSLEALGIVRVADQTGPGAGGACGRVPSHLLSVSGFSAADGPEIVQAGLAHVLLAPEAYLAARGQAFEPSQRSEPPLVASRERDASPEERGLAAHVTAWPEPLLRVEPAYRDATGRVRHEGEVVFVGVVGEDGLLRTPSLRTPLSSVHEEHVLKALSVWRFAPARRAEGTVGARVSGRLVFRVY